MGITSKYDMDVMKRNRNKYDRERKRNFHNISASEFTLLKQANSVYSTFRRKLTKLKDLKLYLDGMIEQQSQGCKNCKRKLPCDEHSCKVPYELEFKFHPQNSLIKRNAFRFVGQ